MLFKKKRKKTFGLTKEEQDAMIRVLAMGDQKLYVQVLEDVQYLENIQYLTTRMKAELTRNVDIEDIALALKLCSKKTTNSFIKDLSSTMIADFNHILTTKFPFQKMRESQIKVKNYIRGKESKGLFNFDQDQDQDEKIVD